MALDNVEKSTFRWLDAARYAVATVVTVLIVTVIAHAVVVVLRPDPLILSVVGGSVSVDRNDSSRELAISFTLQAANPSGRVRIYYTNISGYLQGKNASTSPATDFLFFDVTAMAVKQQTTLFSYVQVPQIKIDDMSGYESYFNMFYYNDSSIPDAMLKLDGNLTVGIYSVHNQTARQAIYYCSPITIGGDSSGDTAGDVTCTEDPPATAASIS